jgi:hypothetical protein
MRHGSTSDDDAEADSRSAISNYFSQLRRPPPVFDIAHDIPLLVLVAGTAQLVFGALVLMVILA